MVRSWRILYLGLAYPVCILSCLLLAAPANAAPGDTQNSQLPAPVMAQRQGPASITALLAKLEKQIVEDAATASDTIVDILMLLPNASPSDTKFALTIPLQYAKRAREAEAAGHYDEASRFAAMGDVLGNLLSGATPNTASGQQPTAKPPIRASNTPSVVDHTLPNNPLAQDAPITTPNQETRLSQQPAMLAERTIDNHPEMAAAEPKPATAAPMPAMAMERSSLADPTMNEAVKPLPAQELNGAVRETVSATHGEFEPPFVETPFRKPAANPHALINVARVPAVQRRRTTIPSSARLATAMTKAVDPQCRAIVLKFAIGEEPSDAERTYLRQGCHQHG
jgi:hypothetical protein